MKINHESGAFALFGDVSRVLRVLRTWRSVHLRICAI